tara:strand:+ start:586 stop:1326 length:741 start_codon:yes stop_codon:yes gene_type:complete
MATSKENQKEKSRKLLALQKKYAQRITIAKQGFEAFRKKDYIVAAAKYKEYLGIHANLHDIEDIYKLNPSHFNQKTEVTEMLLISHAYWELARINEQSPELARNFQRSLDQFVRFTANQPYQVLNAEMLRKYIKKLKGTSPQNAALNQAYSQIFIQSKKCFIATLSYGQDHPITHELREFKQSLLKTKMGFAFVEHYYRYSSLLVERIEDKKYMRTLFICFSRPPLWCLAKIFKLSILKSCFYSQK